MQFLRFLSDSRWEHNVQRAAQDSLWDGATLRPQGMDAAVGANRTKFYSAPSTDSLCNCCSTQLHLSTSASSFCRVAPGDICRFFTKHAEITQMKKFTKIWNITDQSRGVFEGLQKESSGKMFMKTKKMCSARAKCPCSVTGLYLECMSADSLD